MSIKITDIILSLAIGLLAIYTVHDFIVTDACLDSGGAINTETGHCIDENYHEQYMVFSPVLLSIYFVIGLIFSVLSALIIKSIRRANSE